LRVYLRLLDMYIGNERPLKKNVVVFHFGTIMNAVEIINDLVNYIIVDRR